MMVKIWQFRSVFLFIEFFANWIFKIEGEYNCLWILSITEWMFLKQYGNIDLGD